jgi:hypothetical protein
MPFQLHRVSVTKLRRIFDSSGSPGSVRWYFHKYFHISSFSYRFLHGPNRSPKVRETLQLLKQRAGNRQSFNAGPICFEDRRVWTAEQPYTISKSSKSGK